MPPGFMDGIIAVVGMLGVGSLVLIGMKLRYAHLRDMKHAPSAEQLEQITTSIERLQDQVRVLHEGMVDLNERVDFTERVLTRGRNDGEPGALPNGRG